MHRPHRSTGALQARRDLHQAARVGGHEDVGARVEHVPHFSIPQRPCGVGFEQIVNAGRSAADVALGDFPQFEPWDGPQYLARLLTNALGVLQVARVVIGDTERQRMPGRARLELRKKL